MRNLGRAFLILCTVICADVALAAKTIGLAHEPAHVAGYP
jgi:hypothetical protein